MTVLVRAVARDTHVSGDHALDLAVRPNTMTALLQRLRIWCAQRLLDLGLIEAAKRGVPSAPNAIRPISDNIAPLSHTRSQLTPHSQGSDQEALGCCISRSGYYADLLNLD